jgi:hypothetical protein
MNAATNQPSILTLRLGQSNQAGQSWNSSFRVWNEGHWKLLLDLITETGAVSDLVLHAKVTERGEAYAIEPGLIYVP